MRMSWWKGRLRRLEWNRRWVNVIIIITVVVDDEDGADDDFSFMSLK